MGPAGSGDGANVAYGTGGSKARIATGCCNADDRLPEVAVRRQPVENSRGIEAEQAKSDRSSGRHRHTVARLCRDREKTTVQVNPIVARGTDHKCAPGFRMIYGSVQGRDEGPVSAAARVYAIKRGAQTHVDHICVHDGTGGILDSCNH